MGNIQARKEEEETRLFSEKVIERISIAVIDSGDGFTGVSSLMQFSATSKFIRSAVNTNNAVWKKLLKIRYPGKDIENELLRFGVLVKRNEDSSSFRSLFLAAARNVVQRERILIGDRNNPEKTAVIELKGDGKCFIGYERDDGGVPEMKLVQDYNSDISIMTNAVAWAKTKVQNYQTKSLLKGVKIVSVQCYDPTTVLLCSDGTVLECMFLPSYIEGYSEFRVPSQIDMSAISGKVVRVFCFASFNFAVTDNRELCSWTTIDYSGKKIRLRPAEIKLVSEFLQRNLVEITDMIESTLDQIPVIFVSLSNGEKITLRCSDVMEIIIRGL